MQIELCQEYVDNEGLWPMLWKPFDTGWHYERPLFTQLMGIPWNDLFTGHAFGVQCGWHMPEDVQV